MEPKCLRPGKNVIKPKLECTTLESIPEMSVPGLTWSPSLHPRTHGSPMAIRSRSLPGPAGSLGLPTPTTPPPMGTGSISPRLGISDREIKILVIGCQGVGKSALVVRYLTKRFIGDYAPYETMCTAETAVDYKKVKVSIFDMSWKTHTPEDIDKYLDWCDGALFLFSLVDKSSFKELESFCVQLESKLKCLPCVLVGTKSDLTMAIQTSQSDAQNILLKLKCPYVETSARESHSSAAHAFVTLIHEIRTNKKKPKAKKHINKNGYSSKLQNMRDKLRSIAGEFRQRTNTF